MLCFSETNQSTLWIFLPQNRIPHTIHYDRDSDTVNVFSQGMVTKTHRIIISRNRSMYHSYEFPVAVVQISPFTRCGSLLIEHHDGEYWSGTLSVCASKKQVVRNISRITKYNQYIPPSWLWRSAALLYTIKVEIRALTSQSWTGGVTTNLQFPRSSKRNQTVDTS